jgi:hypothetical protein
MGITLDGKKITTEQILLGSSDGISTLSNVDLNLLATGTGVVKVNDTLLTLGNVGIKNSNPQFTLDVTGSANITNGLTVSGNNLYVPTNAIVTGQVQSQTGKIIDKLEFGTTGTRYIQENAGDGRIYIAAGMIQASGDITSGNSGQIYSNTFRPVNAGATYRLSTDGTRTITDVSATNSISVNANLVVTGDSTIANGLTVGGVAKITNGLTVGGDTNNFSIGSNGRMILHGHATGWEDLIVPVTATKTGGSKDPTFSRFLDNGAGSQGVFAYQFSSTEEQELYFSTHMPHSYKPGTSIIPHVHWGESTPSIGGVVWGLEYTWTNTGQKFPATQLITVTVTTDGLTADNHLTPLPTINGAGKNVGSIINGRVYRDATNLSDDYNASTFLFNIDFHFLQNSVGTDGLTTKGF